VGEYQANYFEGPYLKYHNNGKIGTKCFFRQGWRHGEYIEYNEDGTLIQKGEYYYGQKVGFWYVCFPHLEYCAKMTMGEKKLQRGIGDYMKDVFYEDLNGNRISEEELKKLISEKRKQNKKGN